MTSKKRRKAVKRLQKEKKYKKACLLYHIPKSFFGLPPKPFCIKPFSSLIASTEIREITLVVQPTTGGCFNITVKSDISVLELRHAIARKLQMPKDRLAMLCKSR